MKTFSALVLEKTRLILLLKNAPSMAKELREQVSEEDWKVIEGLVGNDGASSITPAILVELIKAYDAIGRSHIEALPMELAVIAVCG